MISEGPKKHYWNYFLAIENDLENLSRYIEFSRDNLATYSIELAQIILTTASEVDVILKEIFSTLGVKLEKPNMFCYRKAIVEHLPEMIEEEIFIGRSSLRFKPWENLNNDKAPDWWAGYNAVKHQRNDFFNKANLQNALNAVGGLLIAIVFYYKLEYEKLKGESLRFKDVTRNLHSNINFVKMNGDYYAIYLVC